MGEGGAFLVGLLLGGVGGGSAGFQGGYSQRNNELQPYIHSLEQQIRVKDQELWQKDEQSREKDTQIAELQRRLEAKDKHLPSISDIAKKLGGS